MQHPAGRMPQAIQQAGYSSGWAHRYMFFGLKSVILYTKLSKLWEGAFFLKPGQKPGYPQRPQPRQDRRKLNFASLSEPFHWPPAGPLCSICVCQSSGPDSQMSLKVHPSIRIKTAGVLAEVELDDVVALCIILPFYKKEELTVPTKRRVRSHG
jgi:hypothetical protein